MSNPPALVRFWNEFKAGEPTALLGGISADKRGYHNTRNNNIRFWPGDYSYAHVSYDREGSGDYAGGIDLTLPSDKMRLYTNRLDAAARRKDPRLYVNGVPVLREFIGTKDGTSVYCYVLIGGKPLGVGADAGPDPGRDRTHLWHIHLSVIRKFANNWPALEGVLSVMLNKPLKEQGIMLVKYGDGQANGKEEEVKFYQRRLDRLGFNPGAFDGEYGDATQKAVTASRTKLGYGNPGAKEITGTHAEELDNQVSELASQEAANAVAKQMKTALEQAIANLPSMPSEITLDLPDVITVPTKPSAGE